MKVIKVTSWFLGISMFMFGFLKFFNPFKAWYTLQISGSGLSSTSYIMGIAGELTIGIVLLYCMIRWNSINLKLRTLLLAGSSIVIVVMMVTGIYVHLQPDVPADVLPLKIKPPYIPAFFMLLGVWNSWNAFQLSKL